MQLSVILPASGTGTRFGLTDPTTGGMTKVEARLADRPIFMHAIEMFQHRDDVAQIILAVHPDVLERFRISYGDQLDFLDVALVAGGTVDRWQTVQRALEVVRADATHIAVHDAARPLTGKALIDRVFAAAEQHHAVIPALPVNATLKRVGPETAGDASEDIDPLDAILGSAGRPDVAVRPVLETVDRRDIVEAQTPQVFSAELFRRVYADLGREAHAEVMMTDDAGLVEACGGTVMTVEGDVTNLKVTHPEDLKLAEAILAASAQVKAATEAKRRLFADDEEDS